MIDIIKYPARNKWPQLLRRPVFKNISMRQTVQTILLGVKKEGDVALMEYEKLFHPDNSRDKYRIPKVSGTELALTEELKLAIKQAKENIERFHQREKEELKIIETMPGIQCWQKSVPIERVGLYIPGGTAPLFSTVLMLGVPAQIAGCKEIVLCSPPCHSEGAKRPRNLLSEEPCIPPLLKERGSGGEVNAAVKYAASLCNITKIFPIGGAQAIAAMAYGTQTIPKVDKIFGPGNQYVTLAKQLVQMEGVAIDMPAGPSELLIIADETAIPAFVAADLLSQAEHGPDSQVILVCTDESIAGEVLVALNKQLQNLPRRFIAEQALKTSKIILLNTIDEAIDLSNQYAPEHLILAVEDPNDLAEKITSAGSVFLGNYSPEAAGDYATGTNHVLPTNGYARSYSGISVDSFMKKITFQQLSKEGLNNISTTVMTMASAEGLEAHKNAVSIRLPNLEPQKQEGSRTHKEI